MVLGMQLLHLKIAKKKNDDFETLSSTIEFSFIEILKTQNIKNSLKQPNSKT